MIGLAEEHGLRFDAPHAPAHDPEAVDHRRVGVRSDDGVRKGEGHPVLLAAVHHAREVLKVNLVHDPGARGHDLEVREGVLGPAEELVALAVPLVLALHIPAVRLARPREVDLDGVVDDEIGGHLGVDALRGSAEPRERVAHRGKVHDGGYAGEVLEDHARRHERYARAGVGGAPRCHRLDILLGHVPIPGLPEDILEKDPDREWEPVYGRKSELFETAHPVEGSRAL